MFECAVRTVFRPATNNVQYLESPQLYHSTDTEAYIHQRQFIAYITWEIYLQEFVANQYL